MYRFNINILSVFIFVASGFYSGSSKAAEIESKIDLGFTSCANTGKALVPFAYDGDCLQKVYDNHPSVNANSPLLREAINKPVTDRQIVPDQEFLQFLILDNLLFESPKYENIKAVTEPKLLDAAVQGLKKLPTEFQTYIEKNFYGFMVVSGIGWTGLSETITDPNDASKSGAVIVINSDFITGKNLSQWMSFKENTAFQFGEVDSYPRVRLKIKFTNGGMSTVEDFFRYFLTHETSHLIAGARPELHPPFKYGRSPIPESIFRARVGADGDIKDAYPFLNFSWNLVETTTATGERAYMPRPKVPQEVLNILESKRVRFYSTDMSLKFTKDEAKVIYTALKKTCFPSLYAMVDYTEDFAESLAHYFFIKKDGYSLKTTLVEQSSKNSKSRVLVEYDDDMWSRPECQAKVDFIRGIFEK